MLARDAPKLGWSLAQRRVQESHRTTAQVPRRASVSQVSRGLQRLQKSIERLLVQGIQGEPEGELGAGKKEERVVQENEPRLIYIAEITVSSVNPSSMSSSSKVRILNQDVGVAPQATPRPPSDLALELQRTMLQMKGEFITKDGKGVNYELLTHSELFKRYQGLTSELEQCDPSQLDEDERKAFFISIQFK